MGGRLFLGNQMISPVIIQGNGGGAFNVDGYDWLGEINAQGELVTPTKDLNIVFNGVKEINSAVLEEKFEDDGRVKSVSFPDLEVIGENGSFYNSFYDSGLESFTAPKLKRIELNSQDFEYCFTGTKLEILSLPELEFVNDNGLAFACPSCQYLKTLSLPKLKTIGASGMYQAFSASDLSGTVNLNSLEVIEISGMYAAFVGTNIKSFSFNSLRTVKGNGLGQCFIRTPLEAIRFHSLNEVGNGGLNRCFSECKNLTDVFFDSLDSNSFGEYTNQFNYMLHYCDGVTVHFPAGLDAVIGNWSDVLAGFGGTNITILYDSDPCYADITVVGTDDCTVYVKGKSKTNPILTDSTDKEYIVYDNRNHRIFFGMLTGLVVDEISYFTADTALATNKITLATGVSGLTVNVSYCGNPLPLETDGNGNYYFYTMTSGKEFSYTIEETQTTKQTTGTFTTNGSDLTISATPTPKGWETFTRPNLLRDGTMGVDDFAVTSSGCYSSSSSRQAYNAVNGDTSTSYYWYSTNITNPIYYFYNKKQLKVATLSFRWTATSYRATQVVVDGSNDYENWTNVGTYTLDNATTAMATINSNTPYNYYRLTFTKGGTYIRLVDLGITGTEYR